MSSITEHPISPKLDRPGFKPVSSKPMEYQPSPTRTATQHGNIYRLAPVPASASMHAPSSPFSLPSSPASLPSELPHHSAYLLRPGPPTVDDPDVSCGQASLTLFNCLFKSFKRNSSTNETPKDRRALKKKAKTRRVPTAEVLVEKASKRPNRRGYYRFTDEEMEEHNVTRDQLMSWRENRVRSHLFHGHEGYQGSHQMTSQGVPVTFLIPPQ
ncbi:hypothetical protein FS842_001164 [Serendipita sp. 407]|nr:hypothetical protein FS842_001164 [Serendipita sp. 407]